MLVKEPGSGEAGGGADAAGALGRSGTAEGARAAGLNMLVNSPGPETRGDGAGIGGAAGDRGGSGSAEGTGGALNMLVKEPGAPALDVDAAGALGRSGSTGGTGGALNMLVNEPAAAGGAGAAGAADTVGALGKSGAAAEPNCPAWNMLVNSPGLAETGVAGGISECIAKVPPGVAGSSGIEGEYVACVPDPTDVRLGLGNRIVRVTETGGISGLGASDGGAAKTPGAGAEDSAACAA
jgi:hypothetical protein